MSTTPLMTTYRERGLAPCDGATFRAFMSQFPTGVTVVTSADRDTPIGCTVNAVMSVSLSPTLLVIALNNGSRTLDAVRGHGRFALNLLNADQEGLCRHFATRGAADRFQHIGYHWAAGVPMLDDVTSAVVCDVHELIECGDHMLVVGAPQLHLLSPNDDPLVFYRSAFHELAAPGHGS